MKKPPFHIPRCEHAQLLVNPRALYLLQQHGHPSHPVLRLPGAYADDGTVGYYYQLARQRIGDSKDYSILSDWYVTEGCQFEYIFTVVKCGQCPLCVESRQLDIVNRCRMESELYSTPAYCFCLTYDDKHLPGLRQEGPYRLLRLHRGQLHYPDVQLFFKRLRRLWDRKGLKHSIRYLVACEYGSRRGRPHYHVILWNNPYCADELHPYLHNQLKQDVFDAWSMMQWSSFSAPGAFGQAGDGAAAYAAKYAAKQQTYRLTHHLPPGYPPPSIHMSIGAGGIGRPFIERMRSYFHANPSADRLQWSSRHDGSFHWVRIGSYVKQVLWPSPSRQVPGQIKTAYRELCQVIPQAVRDGVLRSDYGRMLAHQLRPPHYPNLLPSLPRPRADGCHCSLYKAWKLNAIVWPVLEWFNNYLSAYLLEPVPVRLFEYYQYMAGLPQQVDQRGHLSGSLLSSREKQSVMKSRSTL